MMARAGAWGMPRRWVGVALLGILATGCGDDGPSAPGDGPVDTLAFERADGSTVEFPPDAATYVWCGPWEPDVVEVPALHVWRGSAGTGSPGWWLRVVTGDVGDGESFPFPHSFIWDQPSGVHLFTSDPPNELSTEIEESAGYISFRYLPCSGGTIVDFTLDAVIGSENGGPPLTVTGRFRAHLTEVPPWTSGKVRKWPRDQRTAGFRRGEDDASDRPDGLPGRDRLGGSIGRHQGMR